jgi:hypothetical protein
MGLLGTPLMK